MKKVIDTNNIYMNFKGQIFINNGSKSIIEELSTGKETYYNGNIIGMYENGIINEKDNEITKIIFQ